MRQQTRLFAFSAVFFVAAAMLIIGLIIGVATTAPSVVGANSSNVVARLNVTNAAPTLYAVSLNPNPVDLVPGSITQVTCTALVYDLNGWATISTVNSTLYDISNGYSHFTPDDRNHHYTNSSCSPCTSLGPNNASCSCSFFVEYFANNATWGCNITITDANFTEHMTNTTKINTVLAIGTPPEIDYGDLVSPSYSAERTLDIMNYGNLPINITVRGYGGSDEATGENKSMLCQMGSISVGWMRYSLSQGQDFSDMFNLSSRDMPISSLTLRVRTNDSNQEYGQDINSTYWKIYVPPSVGGLCNGTIVFSAVDAG